MKEKKQEKKQEPEQEINEEQEAKADLYRKYEYPSYVR